ncbi:hypothetical protein [Tropicimonas marinistellae]|uniref:hypothetical protein n=1 Tax=Tropicimonas marinistellae TaxID=1739787 RepID=UPI0013728E8C|nr:hypothetical protein [Tropicimonas marinistellae]
MFRLPGLAILVLFAWTLPASALVSFDIPHLTFPSEATGDVDTTRTNQSVTAVSPEQ